MIGDKEFNIMLNSNEFFYRDIIEIGKIKCQVLDEPREERVKVPSKWKIVNWWRKLIGTEKWENHWVYTVKVVDGYIR